MHKLKIPIEENPLNKIKVRNAIYPIIIGLGVVGYLFYKKFNPSAFDVFTFSVWSVFWIIIAIGFMGFRDFGYILRLRVLTEGTLGFKQSFRVIMLWEFSSAMLPSAFGGTMVAPIYVNKEGLSVGRSSAVVMITSFLDELYFILVFPVLLIIITPDALFGLGVSAGVSNFSQDIFLFCVIGYFLKFVWVVMLSYGLFINPRGLKWLLMLIFKLPILRRWKHGANKAGTDIIQSSIEYRKKPFWFWLKAFGTTFISWTSRYCVVNALFLAFFAVNNHVLIFVRQLAMSIIQLVSPTPGGSGSSEYIFTRYLGEFIPVDATMLGSVVIAMALLWRMVSYYPYLLIGAIIFPKWINTKFVKKESE